MLQSCQEFDSLYRYKGNQLHKCLIPFAKCNEMQWNYHYLKSVDYAWNVVRVKIISESDKWSFEKCNALKPSFARIKCNYLSFLCVQTIEFLSFLATLPHVIRHWLDLFAENNLRAKISQNRLWSKVLGRTNVL